MDLCRLVAVDLVLGRAEDFIMALCLVAEGAQTLFSVPQQRIPLLGVAAHADPCLAPRRWALGALSLLSPASVKERKSTTRTRF